MQLLVYSRILHGEGMDILDTLRRLLTHQQMDVCSGLEALRSNLRRIATPYALAVLICPTREDLLRVSSAAHLFLDMRVVLFVPDLEEETVALGHRLFPRYLAPMDADPQEVMGVLLNLLKKHGCMQA